MEKWGREETLGRKNPDARSGRLDVKFCYITTMSLALQSSFKSSGNSSSVISTVMSSIVANVYGIILPIFELSNIIYVYFAFERSSFNCSASIMLSQAKPLSGVNADAEMMANSKLTSLK